MLLDRDEHDLITLAGISIRVLGYAAPDASDYWGGNWLNIQADARRLAPMCRSSAPAYGRTSYRGSKNDFTLLHRNLQGVAKLDGMEANLSAQVRCETLGHLEVVIEATPDHLHQSQRFVLSLDQSYLETSLQDLRRRAAGG